MKQVQRILWLFSLVVFIAACGGGTTLTRDNNGTGDPAGGGNANDPQGSLSVSATLTDANGVQSTTLSDAQPLTLTASLSSSDGASVAGQLITFVLNQPGLATFSNDTGTALTNDNGVATINVFVGEQSGSGTIAVVLPDESESLIGFESTGAIEEVPFSLELFASSTQLASSGSDTIELIAVIKNEQNILMPSVPVSFSADENASLTILDSVTGEDGTARAELTTTNNPENRTITVVSGAATLSETISVEVVGTEININGASSVILNDSAPLTFLLSDSDGNGIGGQEIILTTDGGTLGNLNPVTNANGQVSVVYTASQSGISTINASALNTSSSFTITVQQDDFSFEQDDLSNAFALNEPHEIDIRWFRDGAAFSNGEVTVTSSRGDISVGGDSTASTTTTDANGIATVTLSSTFAGPASLSAVGVDSDGNQVTARADVNFVATTVDSIFVDATPDIIGPDGQTATITAVVRDVDGNLVQGVVVNFRVFADATGGNISPNTAITDSNGIASSIYTSNGVSQIDGVTLEAESAGITALADLTVGDRAFDISIGTGNEIDSPDSATYRKEFAVFVTDAGGRPITNAGLTATSTPPLSEAYYKGFWEWNEAARVWDAIVTAICANEDINGNGRLDENEDFNGDGQLTPGNVVSISFVDDVSSTDNNGQASFNLRYARQFAPWVNNIITVAGQSSGTESSEQQLYGLAVASADITEESSRPPANPFGFSTDCSNTN